MNISHTHSITDQAEIAAIHAFWLGLPARDHAQLITKFKRWYQGGADVDRVIQQRFANSVERALAGELAAWEAEPRGRLALILLLDQFTRNLFRDTPRAYAGDVKACALALQAIAEPSYSTLPLEERLFCIMPLVHSETLALHDRATELAGDFVLAAAPELRLPWHFGAERTAHYRTIIQRFGRFPHRNEILGRTSTQEELDFLAQEATKAPPLSAATASAVSGGV
ncbi:MAG TPA: DUF924 family protein [Polyangiales bacterium]|nr:DUF924 family protein [Polyangiales bacterium]